MSAAEPVIEVAYALPERQRVVELPWRPDMTAGGAVTESGLAEEFPELAGRTLLLGIFGRRVPASEPLRAGDRVEIYRPLKFDPREARRQAAQSARPGRRAGPTRAGS